MVLSLILKSKASFIGYNVYNLPPDRSM